MSYSSFKNGGNVEFEGYKAYIDPRAEVFLKINNGKKDIFKEFYDLQHGNLDVSEFLEEYNFTHLIVENGDYLYNNMEGQENYEIYYEQGASLRLYIRKDIKEQVNSKLTNFKHIKNVIITDEPMIKTTTNKVKRKEEMKKILA